MSTDEIHVQGIPASALAERFGTPLFVYDTEILESTFRTLRTELPEEIDIFYSLKANPNISVCAFLGTLGACAEVSSYAELLTALRAGIAPGDIIFLGPGKDETELVACVEAGIHAVVCESIAELQLLDELVERSGRDSFPAMLRVNPAFAATGSGLSMGGKPRQFGIDEEIVRGAKEQVAALRRVEVIGLHAYMGTRILNAADVVRNTREILGTAEELAGRLGIPLRTVDVGADWASPTSPGRRTPTRPSSAPECARPSVTSHGGTPAAG